MSEIIIEGGEDARKYFEEFAMQNENVFTEESAGLAGQNITGLVIEKLPEILGVVTALIAVLRGENILFKIKKDGNEISNIDSE